jgi:DNA-directed RNA polymerase specialized sigma24 family protein
VHGKAEDTENVKTLHQAVMAISVPFFSVPIFRPQRSRVLNRTGPFLYSFALSSRRRKGQKMKNLDNQSQSKKQRYYPLRRADDPYSVDLIPVSEEIYQQLTRSISRIRKQEQRAGRCFCSKHLFWKCAADCDVCPYHKKSEFLSLDVEVADENKDISTLIDLIADESDLSEELEERAFKDAVQIAIQSLSSRDREITRLFMDGLSERAIASEINCPRKTVNYRKSVIFKALLEKLSDWF